MEKINIKNSWLSNALVDKNTYQKMYEESINNNDNFWNKQGDRLNWRKKYSKIKNVKYSSTKVNIEWYYF